MLIALLFQQILSAPLVLRAQFAPIPTNNEKLVLVLADTELNSIDGKIKRYAQDIQRNLEKTKVSVLNIKPNEDPVEIASVLKQAYVGNLTKYDGRRLVGITIIGDVPLPVVNRNGNRFVSMYPYTDFDDPYYLYNPESGYFEPEQKSDYEPEIWHGVINFANPADYERYLDKNHAFYEGDPEFADFEQKIFYADPIHEAKGLNSTISSNYQNFLNYMSEIAYNRFTKELRNRMSGSFTDSLEEIASDDAVTDAFRDAINAGGDLPDIQTKTVIEKYFSRVSDIFGKTLADQQAALVGTGRYTNEDYVTPVLAIAMKDEYMMQYFIMVNNMLEQKIDEIVEDVQQNIVIPKGVSLTGAITFFNLPSTRTNDAGILEVVPGPMFSAAGIEPQYFVNNQPSEDFRDNYNELIIELEEGREVTFINGIDMTVNGTYLRDLSSAADCRLYRGGRLGGDLAKTVEIKRGDIGGVCREEWQGRDVAATYREISNQSKCSVFYGDELRDEFRPELSSPAYTSAMTHEACFNFRSLGRYMELIEGEPNLGLATTFENPASFSVSSGSVSLNLLSLLRQVEDFQGSFEDWNSWTSFFFGNPANRTFEVDQPLGESTFNIVLNDQEISILDVEARGITSWEDFIDTYLPEDEILDELRIARTLNLADIVRGASLNPVKIGPSREISSVIHHKDPAADIIAKALENMIASDLPVDEVRHVTFVDQKGQSQSVEYPDLFKADSIEAFRRQVVETERLLSEIDPDNDYGSELTALINSAEDRFNDGKTEIEAASGDSIDDLFEWRTFNLNQKYTRILESLLDDQVESADTLPRSFEIAVINSRANAEGLEYQIITEEAYGLNPGFISDGSQDFRDSYSEQERQRERDNSTPIAVIGEDDTVPFFEWFDYIGEWIQESTNINPETKAAESPDLKSYEEMIGGYGTEISQIRIDLGAAHQSIDGEPARKITVSVHDESGRRVVGNSDYVDINVTGAELAVGTDENTREDGVQLFMVTGRRDFFVKADSVGTINIQASLGEISEQASLQIHQEINTVISASSSSTRVNGDALRFIVQAQNERGQKLVHSVPMITLDNPAVGQINQVTEDRAADEYVFEFIPNTKSGRVTIRAKYEGSNPTSLELRVNPSSPAKLFFDKGTTKVDVNSTDEIEVQVSVLDEFNNLIESSFTDTQIEIDDPSKLELLTPNISFSEGVGSVRLRVLDRNVFGNAFVKASKPGLETALHKLELGNHLRDSAIESFDNTALYYELKTNRNETALASKLISKGKTQVVSTLTTPIEGSLPLFYIHRTGGLEVINTSSVRATTNLDTTEISTEVFDSQDRKVASIKVDPSSIDWKGIARSDITSEPGIYLQPNVSGLTVTDQNILYNDQVIAHINSNGVPVVDIDSVSIQPRNNTNFYALEIRTNNTRLGEILYNFESEGGVRVTPITHPEIIYRDGFTLPSTNSSKGLIFYNPSLELRNEQLPTSTETRDEDSLETPLVGLREGDKSVLLFAAGQTAGEANRPYLSEAGILMGDPVIKLDEPINKSLTTQFGFDVGHYVGRTENELTSIIDRGEYILFADRDGNISKLDKSTKTFQKNIMKVPNGIRELHEVNFEGRQKDLLILTEEACVNKDSCVYLLRDGKLTQIKLNTDGKIQSLIPADYNGDGDDDIAALTAKKTIYLHLNNSGEIRPNGSRVGNTSIDLDGSENLIYNTWISDPNGQFSLRQLISEATTTVTSEADGQIINSTETPAVYSDTKYRPVVSSAIEEGNPLSASTLVRRDDNEGSLRDGDWLTYILTLNSSGADLPNRTISVLLGRDVELNLNSIEPDTYGFIETESEDRRYVIPNVSISDGATVQIRFKARYRAQESDEVAIVNTVTDEESCSADSLPDFKINIPGTDFVTYYCSEFDRSENRLSYEKVQTRFEQVDVSEHIDTPTDLTEETASSLASDLEDQVYGTDSDGDGIVDAVDSLNSGLNDLAHGIEDGINRFMCSGGGGCLALPFNYAFLVPNGFPSPIIGWGCTSVPPVLAGPPAYAACQGGRIYLSPTLTGELATALCLGNPQSGQCWAAPITDLGAACDSINAGIQDLMNSAVDLASDATGGLIAVSTDGDPNAQGGNNIQVPGFPAFLTDWISQQYDEIRRKLLRLPELTIIYPSPASIADGFKPSSVEDDFNVEEVRFDNLAEILAQVHAMPLFDIELETHYIQYPELNPEELNKYSEQLLTIWEENLNVLNRAKDQWSCYGSEFVSESEFVARIKEGDLRMGASTSNECITLSVKTLELFASFDANLDALRDYRDLPRNIFEAENFLADYASQLLGYVDTILDRTAGYISANTSRLQQWQQLFIDVQELIESLSAILDVSIAYMESCDECRSNRTNTGYQLLLNLFVNFPTPPVFAIPQLLPDVTLDISQINAQIDIVLPRFEFKGDPLVLPDLRDLIITLPDAPPVDFSINPGKYGLGVFPTIPPPPDLTPFLLDLPDLPELELPKLPEIPKPPSIEGPVIDFLSSIEVFLDTISTILRIICLLQKGFIPTSENQLRTQIESLTARPLTPVLPIDIGLGFEFPGYSTTYVDEVRFTLETNLGFEFDQLNTAAGDIVKDINKFQTNLNEGFEKTTQDFVDATVPSGEIEIPGTDEIDDFEIDAEIDLESTLYKDLLSQAERLTELEKEISALTPDEITIAATTEPVGELPRLAYVDLNRGFKLPNSLKNEVQKIIAFKEGNTTEFEKFRSTSLIADTEPRSGERDSNIVTKTLTIAAGETPPPQNPASYNPQGGIYIYQSGTSEKVVNYNMEPSSDVEVMITDFDSDGDQDLFYTRGKEMYFKTNLREEPAISRNTARIQTDDFEELKAEAGDSLTLQVSDIKVSAKHKSVDVTIPANLEEKVVVIDVYKAGFERSEKDSRFVIDPADYFTDFAAETTAELSTGQRLGRDDFNMYVKRGYTETVTLPLENRMYQMAVSVLNEDSNRLDVIKPLINVTPNFCSDRSPPVIKVEPAENIKVPILKPIDLYLHNSFDSESEIKTFFIDLDPEIDSDGDGERTNDRDLASPEDRLSSQFRLRGSETETDFSVAVWAEDIAGNLASRRVNINVVTPEIFIDDIDPGEISGHIDPPDDNVDLVIVRNRDGVIEEIGEVTTNDTGGFVFTDLEEEGNIGIFDAEGNQLFEINEETGSVKAVDSSARITIQAARPGQNPTWIHLKKNADTITRMVRVPDSNNDVEIISEEPSDSQLNATTKVFVIDEDDDEFLAETIPGDDPGYSGGVEITRAGQRQAIIDVDGSLILNNSNFRIELEEIRNVNQPQWFLIKDGSQTVARVFVGTGEEEVQLRVPDLNPREDAQPEESTEEDDEPTSGPSTSTFADVSEDDEDSTVIEYLHETGVVDGVVRDGVRYFEPDREITRAEYSKIILNTLCIIPRPEANQAPAVFHDIPYNPSNLPWFYRYTKETQLQRFFTGYLGEINPETGLPPFKPLSPITRAEASKVILEALNTQGILDISSVVAGDPWYVPYLDVSENLTPYLVNPEEIRQDFLLTPAEAEVPLRNITRREFAIMAFRALNVQNCLEVDDDGDGLPYYWEVEHDLDPNSDDSDGDNDGDGIPNDEEYVADTDPNRPENSVPRTQTEAGVYLERIICNTCPCEYTLEYDADIRPGDQVFVILRGDDSPTIYRRSDPVTYEG